MAILSQYDSSSPDLVEEIDLAAENQLVIASQYRHYTLDGIEFADPQWDMAPLAPLLDTMTSTSDFGTKYDYLPDKMSKELYGTHEMWPILLLLNKAKDRSAFRGPKLKFISPEFINQFLDMVRFGRKRALAADEIGKTAITDLTIKAVYV